MEQRTDETARPGVAAEDNGPPPAGDGQTEAIPATADDAGEANGHTPDSESVWSPASLSAASGDRGPGRSKIASGAAFGVAAAEDSQPAAPEGGYQAPGADHEYPSSSAGGAYPAGHSYSDTSVSSSFSDTAAGSGFTSPAADRDYPAPSAPTEDFPSTSVTAHDYGAAPSDSIYGNSGSPRDFAAPPYPAQVTSAPRPASDARPQPETDQAERPSAWQAAAARMPKPQPVPKRPKAQRSQKNGAPARQAHLMVSRFEPWSVMKFSFMISLACFVILFIAVTLLYGTLAGLGVFDSIQKALSNATSGQGMNGVNISHWFSASTILGYTALLGVLNVFLITAFSTVGSVIYNLTAHLVGGVEVTLRETE